MNWFLTWILVATSLALVGWGMTARSRIYQYPFWIGAVTIAFVLPQLPALVHDRFLPEGAYARTIAFTIACVAMCWIGWKAASRPFAFLNGRFDEKWLLGISAVLSLCGAYFYFVLSRLPGQEVVNVQMTGLPVVYIFFSRLLTYGLAIACLCLTRRLSWMALGVVAFDLVFYLDRVLVTGKRGETLELFLILALAVWFHRRLAVPRVVLLGCVVFGTLIMNSLADYRSMTADNNLPALDAVLKIDHLGNLQTVVEDGGMEMRNAMQRISFAAETMNFDYGKFHWNRLVFSYVPAQLVGPRFKASLMLEVPALARNYNPWTGTTETGMTDAFNSFWYFGALKFFLLAYVLGRFWQGAEAGQFLAQVAYILSIVPAMNAISHTTDWVVMVWVHMLIFLVPALVFARLSSVGRARPPIPGAVQIAAAER